MMKKIVLSLFSICSLIHIVMGQNQQSKQTLRQPSFVLGVVDTIRSVELGETRTLNIYLPEGYSPDSSATYPVIYLLDGSATEDFIHIVGIVQFLTMIESMPKSIVVGIANVDRRRDFTFPTAIKQDKKDYPTTGSSSKFISFIEKELEPFIEKNYKVNNTKTIIGQSLGGLLATEVLLKKSYLFDNYFIVSPSLWWDNESLLTEAQKLLEKQGDRNIRVYVLVGNEGKQAEADTKRLTEIITTSGKKNFHAELITLPNETHLTILHNSIYKGLKTLYLKTPEKD